jgi:transcriptional regulator
MEGTLSRVGQLLRMWMPKGIRPMRPMPQSNQTIPRNHHTTTMKLEDSITIVSDLRAKGLTMGAIGRQLGVSRQRIHQIIHARESEIEPTWTNGTPTRSIKIIESLKLKTKQEVAEAIILEQIFPNMTKNFGIKSYFDLCKWANVQPPNNLKYPKRPHAPIINP